MKINKLITTTILTTLITFNTSSINVSATEETGSISIDEVVVETKEEISNQQEILETDTYYAELFTITPTNVEKTEFAIVGFKNPSLLSSDGVLTIPSTINGNVITSIKKNAFIRNTQITKVIISEGIVKIDDSAFEGNSNLTEVSLPSSIRNIGVRAFLNNQISSIYLPEGLQTIGALAFLGNGMTELQFPASLYYIGQQAFADNKLTTLTIPTTVTSLHHGAFARNQLTQVSLPEGMTTIPESLFSLNQLTEISFPSTVTKIEQYAFSGNQSLKELIIPDHITFIGASSFSGCGLEKLSLPNTLEVLGAASFSNNALTSVTIPDSITTLFSSVFSNNHLTEIEIPKSVTEIQWNAFENNKISVITIPGTVTTVRGNAFAGNPITYYTLESGVKFVEPNAFLGLNGYLLGGTIADTLVGESESRNFVYQISTTPKHFIINHSETPLSYGTSQGLLQSDSTTKIEFSNWRASRTSNVPTTFVYQEGVSQMNLVIPSRWESPDSMYKNYNISLVELNDSYIIDRTTKEQSTTLYGLSFMTKQEVLDQLENTIPVKPGYTFIEWNTDNISMNSFEELPSLGTNDVYLLGDITGIYPVFEKDSVDTVVEEKINNVVDGNFVIPNTGKK